MEHPMAEDKKQRIKELYEMIEIVLLSIPREITAQKFYQKAVDKASSETTKKFFQSFVNEEKQHEDRLRKILKNLQEELSRLKTDRCI